MTSEKVLKCSTSQPPVQLAAPLNPLSYLHYTILSVLLSKLLPLFSGQLSSTKSHEWLQLRAICAPGVPSNPLSYLGCIILTVFVKAFSHKVIDYSQSIYMTLKSNQWLLPPASFCSGYTGLLARRHTQVSVPTSTAEPCKRGHSKPQSTARTPIPSLTHASELLIHKQLFIYLLRPQHSSSQWCGGIFRFHVGCRCCSTEPGHGK